MNRERFESRAEGDASAQIDQELSSLANILESYDPDRAESPDPGELLSIVGSEMPRLIDEANKSGSLSFDQRKKIYQQLVPLRQIATEKIPISDQKRLILDAFKELENKLTE
ncbi:hypothetical protein IID19_02670 [Patescibacteria group bacterium]|nr:hypothetical protein [Patescibacteria group bacterium]